MRAMALAVGPRMKVVRDQREAEADFLGAPGAGDQLGRFGLFGRE